MSLYNCVEDKTEHLYYIYIRYRVTPVYVTLSRDVTKAILNPAQTAQTPECSTKRSRKRVKRDAHSIEQFISEQEDILNQSIGSVGICNTGMDDCTDIDIPEYVFHNVESSCQTEFSCSCSCAQSSKRPSRTFGTQTETRMSTEEISEYLRHYSL